MKTIIKIKPIIFESEDGYTIFDSNCKGGAIISDKDKTVAMEKFKEASHLACAVKSLMEFKIEKGIENNFYIPEFI